MSSIPTSGVIKSSQIKNVFNGPSVIRLRDYYRGNALTADMVGGTVPYSGLIKFSDFRGVSKNSGPSVISSIPAVTLRTLVPQYVVNLNTIFSSAVGSLIFTSTAGSVSGSLLTLNYSGLQTQQKIYTVTVTATDVNSKSTTTTFGVTEWSLPPIVLANSVDYLSYGNYTYNLLTSFSGYAISSVSGYSIVSQAPENNSSISNGSTLNINADYRNKSYFVTTRATDGQGQTVDWAFLVTEYDAPSPVSVGSISETILTPTDVRPAVNTWSSRVIQSSSYFTNTAIQGDQTLTYTYSVTSDTDSGTGTTINLDSNTGAMTVTGAGRFKWYSVTVTARNRKNKTATQTAWVVETGNEIKMTKEYLGGVLVPALTTTRFSYVNPGTDSEMAITYSADGDAAASFNPSDPNSTGYRSVSSYYNSDGTYADQKRMVTVGGVNIYGEFWQLRVPYRSLITGYYPSKSATLQDRAIRWAFLGTNVRPNDNNGPLNDTSDWVVIDDKTSANTATSVEYASIATDFYRFFRFACTRIGGYNTGTFWAGPNWYVKGFVTPFKPTGVP